MLSVVLRFGVYWVKRFLYRRKGLDVKRPLPFDAKKAYYVASVVAFAPVVLLALHAFSQLRWTDVVLVASLVTVATFYILKRG